MEYKIFVLSHVLFPRQIFPFLNFRKFNSRSGHSLSNRFQILENIRISKIVLQNVLLYCVCQLFSIVGTYVTMHSKNWEPESIITAKVSPEPHVEALPFERFSATGSTILTRFECSRFDSHDIDESSNRTNLKRCIFRSLQASHLSFTPMASSSFS